MKKDVKELRKILKYYRLERFKDVFSDDDIVNNCLFEGAKAGGVCIVPAILLAHTNENAAICLGIGGGILTLAAGAFSLAKGFKDSVLTENIKLTKNEIKGKVITNKQKVLKQKRLFK